jgi:hypothetical protein
MEEMRRAAFACAQRACLFGALAIFCTMVGLSDEPRLALKAGGMLTLMMALVLVYKAHEARRKNYRRTEMWLYVPKHVRPPEAIAQKTVSALLRETYLDFALWTSAVAVVMWVLALVLGIAGL